MFKGYNLTLESVPDFLTECKDEGEASYDSLNKKVNDAINSLKSNRGIIDGSKLQANWFPIVKADVFISHSSLDIDSAKMLAGWIKRQFNLEPFIDSCIWGNAYKLLRMIDDKYCYNKESNTYNYDLRNVSTSHVYMMLTNALATMINNTECILFLNTPQSIVPDEHDITKTYSPWIYTEIAMSNMVEKRKDRDIISSKALYEIFEKAAELKMTQDVDLSDYQKLTQHNLSRWGQCGKKGYNALDYLYDIIK